MHNDDFDKWLSEQSKAFQALASELSELQEARKMEPGFTASVLQSRDGRDIYEIRCANGQHQSYESFEAALEDLLEGHRTRAEDTEEVYSRYIDQAKGDVKLARRIAANVARSVREENPEVKGSARDELVMAAVDESLKPLEPPGDR